MEVESMLAQLDARETTSEHRLRDLEEEMRDLRELTRAVSVTSTNVEHLQQEIGELRGDVKAIADLPARRWETVVAATLTAVAGAVIGLLSAALL